MKAVKLFQKVGLLLAAVLVFTFAVTAQEDAPKKRERIAKLETELAASDSVKTSEAAVENKSAEQIARNDKKRKKKNKKSEEKEIVENAPQTDEAITPDVEAAVLPYYNNYLTEYRLGPNDVISVEVFGQCPDYCKTDLTVPPTARISYPLIREGVKVGGKTVEEVQDEITKKLDEYIIDPKVSVTLVKAMSARYSVLGKVATPGVRVMDRKVSLYEAIVEAGGVLKDGDKKRVTLYRFGQDGKLVPQTVNLTEIERGRGEMIYLNPGDQVFVPDQGFKLNPSTIFKILERASIARLLFGLP